MNLYKTSEITFFYQKQHKWSDNITLHFKCVPLRLIRCKQRVPLTRIRFLSAKLCEKSIKSTFWSTENLSVTGRNFNCNLHPLKRILKFKAGLDSWSKPKCKHCALSLVLQKGIILHTILHYLLSDSILSQTKSMAYI